MNIQPSLKYFNSLIDKNGIIQFTDGVKKNYSTGYAVEDQARALLVALILKDQKLIKRLHTYLVEMIAPQNGVYMIKTADGEILNKTDGFGEASAEVYWSLAEYYSRYPKKYPKQIMEYLMYGLKRTQFMRAVSYTLLGATTIMDTKNTKLFADVLVRWYEKNKDRNWIWYENTLTYANSLMPWALFKAYDVLKNMKYKKVALDTLEFLLINLEKKGIPVVVGNKGWWGKNKKIPLFDQQPIDVSYLVLTCLKAYETSGMKLFLDKARIYYEWFWGNNILKKKMIDKIGRCADGLTEKGPKKDSGAESNICFLLASLTIENFKKVT